MAERDDDDYDSFNSTTEDDRRNHYSSPPAKRIKLGKWFFKINHKSINDTENLTDH
jgi:hypothetical protein